MRYRNRDIPQDWRILERHGFMGFPTRIHYQPPNAEVGEWISRRQRKQKRQLGGVCFFLGAFLQLLETNRENAEGNRDNADNTSISPRDTSHVAEG